MATAQAIKAGAAFVQLYVDDNRLTRGLRRAQQKLKAFAASLKSVGSRMLSLGSASAVPFALATKSFADFESAMARVLALTGASEDEFARLTGEAKRLGATTAFSASQAAEAMGFFALAGFKVDDILRATGPTLNLAAAGQLELAEAADIATKIMSGMGLTADELQGAIDVMAKAMTTANTDLRMLGDAFKFVGPIAKTAGISLEEITAAIQLLSNAGIQGEMAGTTLRGMILSLTSPSSEAQKELQRLGVRVKDGAGNVRSLTDIIRDLENALAGVGSGEKLASLGTIFPARQAAGAAELVAQGAERLEQATKDLGSAGGTAARIAATQLDTLKGSAAILKSALEGLAIVVGEALAPVLREWGKALTSVVTVVSRAAQRNKKLFTTIAKVIAVVVGVGAVLVTLGLVIQGVIFALGGLATVLTLVGTLIGALLSPIGLVIAALGALGTWFVTTTETGSQAMSTLGARFRQMGSTFMSVWKGIVDAVRAGDLALATKIVWLSLKLIWKGGLAFLEEKWLDFKNFFVNSFYRAVFGISRFLNDAWAGIQIAWAETTAFLADKWHGVVGYLQKSWHRFGGFFRKVWARVKSAFGDSDAEAEIARINREIAQQEQAIDARRDQARREVEQERQRRRQAIEGDRQAVEDELNRMQAQERAEREAAKQADLQQTAQELEAAKRELQGAIGEAARKRAAAEGQAGAEPPGPGKKALDRAKGQIPSLQSVADTAERKVDVKGTFNALAVRGLGSSSLSERTVRATEQVAANTKKLVQEAQHGGLVFA